MSGFCFVRIINNACHSCSAEALHKLKLTTVFFFNSVFRYIFGRALGRSILVREKCAAAAHTHATETQTFRQPHISNVKTRRWAHVSVSGHWAASDARRRTNNARSQRGKKPGRFASFHYDRSMVLCSRNLSRSDCVP